MSKRSYTIYEIQIYSPTYSRNPFEVYDDDDPIASASDGMMVTISRKYKVGNRVFGTLYAAKKYKRKLESKL